MQIKLLENLVEEMAGMNSGKIVEILFNKKDVNEFLIAKKMNLTINQVRNILYKLSADGLVSFIRKRDKRKGWYIYYWTLDTEKCLVNLEQALLKRISELKSQLNSRETKRFYICNTCNIEVSEENALDHGFTCEECADVYELANNENHLKDIKLKIARVERDLKLIQGELDMVRAKKNKSKPQAKDKSQKKLKIKNKTIKKSVKKVVKKVVKKTTKNKKKK